MVEAESLVPSQELQSDMPVVVAVGQITTMSQPLRGAGVVVRKIIFMVPEMVLTPIKELEVTP
jgi:hypothetical protein